jgi:ureidoglycolate lyase
LAELRIEAGLSAMECADALAPLCRLLSTGLQDPDIVNQGRARRHSFGGLEHAPGLQLATAIFEVAPRALPFQVDLLERHPNSDQLILPLRDVDSWVVLAAPDRNGGPDLQRLRAVRLSGAQGVVYARGTWHLPIFHEGPTTGQFLVQSMKAGNPDDCVEQELNARGFTLR